MEKNRQFLKIALTCAIVGGISCNNKALADINITNANGLSNSSNYRSNTTTNILNDITLNTASLLHLQTLSNTVLNGNNHVINGAGTVSEFKFNNFTNLLIQNLKFSNFNHYGTGLLYVNNGTTATFNNVTVDGITFSGNDTIWGAAIDIDSDSSLLLQDSLITNLVLSTSSGGDGASGGGILVQGENGGNRSVLTIHNTEFSNIEMTASVAPAQGAAVFNEGYIPEITDSKFINNSAIQSASGNAYGGGLTNGSTNDGRGNATIDLLSNTQFSGNSVQTNRGDAMGGAIWTKSGSIITEMTNVIFDSNTAVSANGNGYGGAIYNNGTININNTNFTNNTAKTAGGAIYNAGLININSATFSENTAGGGENDIYFAASGIMNVQAGGEVIINSGLASANNAGTINILDGASLIISDNNSDNSYSGAINIASYGLLTLDNYVNSINASINSGNTKIIGNQAGIDLNWADTSEDNYIPLGSMIGDGVTNFNLIKSNVGTAAIGGDLSAVSADILLNEGTLIFRAEQADDKFFIKNADTKISINDGTNFIYDVADGISGQSVYSLSTTGENKTGIFTKDGSGRLDIIGDSTTFAGTVNVTGGTLAFAESDENAFFAPSTVINVGGEPGATFEYSALSGEILQEDSFTTLNLINGGTFSYIAGVGETVINNDFYTSDETGNKLVFDGALASSLILNTDFAAADYATFKNAKLKLIDGLNTFNSHISLDNTELDLISDKVIKDYYFDNLNAVNNSKLSVDVSLGETPYGDMIHSASGDGIVNISRLGILEDNGYFTNEDHTKVVQIIDNDPGSTLSLAASGTTLEGAWSTNVYEYLFGTATTKTENDSVKFTGLQASDYNSLKKMNNYNNNSYGNLRGFSIVENADGTPYTYYINRDLETTEHGIFTVSGVTADTSIISGIRGGLDPSDKGSFFELTIEGSDTKHFTEFTLTDVTVQDGYVSDRGGSILYSTASDAVANIENVKIINNASVGNGGAFDIENIGTLNIENAEFTGNISTDGLGGAIYTKSDLSIYNTNFSDNEDKNGANDIYLANGAALEYTTGTDNDNTIAGGFASEDNSSSITKLGNTTLNLYGDNSGYTGSVDIEDGELKYQAQTADDKFFDTSDSEIKIGINASLTLDDAGVTDLSVSNLTGEGTLNKDGSNTLEMSGDNKDFTGQVNINEGEIYYTTGSDTDSFVNASEINFAQDTKLTVDTNGYSDSFDGSLKSVEEGNGTFVKTGEGEFNITGDNSSFTGEVNIEEGTLTYTNETDKHTFYVKGNTNVSENAELKYVTNKEDVLEKISGNGLLTKAGEEKLIIQNHNFEGSADVSEGTLEVISKTENADNLDFEIKVSNDAVLDYIATDGTKLIFDNTSSDNALFGFDANAKNATASFSYADVVLGTIDNAAGNNIVINNADDIKLSAENYAGSYALKNSTLNLMDDRTVKSYTFDGLSSENSKLTVNVSLGTSQGSDLLNVVNGDGTLNLTALAIVDDNGQFDNSSRTKTVQVINNTNGTLGIKAIDGYPKLAEWSTNIYEYEINAVKSNSANSYYDSLEFVGVRTASPNSLRIMNHERSEVRGFSVIGSSVYNIAQDLDTTLTGNFTVLGNSRNSIISGERVEYTIDDDGNVTFGTELSGERGSFLELTQNNTTLNVYDVTIENADRTAQDIKDGSVLYMNNANTTANLDNVVFRGSSSAGNGGAIAVIDGTLNIQDSAFENNTANGVSNDIYIAQGKEVVFTANDDTSSSIMSGLSGEGTLVKEGEGTLSLSGVNKDFGVLDLKEGVVNYNQSEDGSFVGGSVKMAEDTVLNYDNDAKDIINNISSADTTAKIEITGAGTVELNGDNSGFSGSVNVNEGSLTVNIDSDDDKFFDDESKTVIAQDSNINFNIADGRTLEVDNNGSLISGDGQLHKTGEGTLILTGDNSNLNGLTPETLSDGSDAIVGTVIENGILEYKVENDDAVKMIKGMIDIQEDGELRIVNNSDSGYNVFFDMIEDSVHQEGITGEGTFSAEGDVNLSGYNKTFTGRTNVVENSELSFEKTDSNAFVQGIVNLEDNSKLEYTSAVGSNEEIQTLVGTGTLDKLGADGSLTVNATVDGTERFTGAVNVEDGTLTINASKQEKQNLFDYFISLKNDAELNYKADASDVYDIDKNAKISFAENADGASVNFENGTYNLNSDIVRPDTNSSVQNVSFTDAAVNIKADSQDKTFNDSYEYNSSSVNYDLQDNSINNIVFNNVTSSADSNITMNLDVDFASDKSDTLSITGSTADTVIKSADDVNILNMDKDSGNRLVRTYEVIKSSDSSDDASTKLSLASDDWTYDSPVYKYMLSTSDDGSSLILTATGMQSNSLSYQNHINAESEREWHFVGDDDFVYVDDNSLSTTLAGSLLVEGKDNNPEHSKISGDNVKSFFENDTDSKLTVKNVTLQNANSGDKAIAAVFDVRNENAVVNVENTIIKDNVSANGEASAIYNEGTINLSDVEFSGNTGDSYIYNDAVINISASKDMSLNNNTGAVITNNGEINISTEATDGQYAVFEVTDAIKSLWIGDINVKQGSVKLASSVSNQNIDLASGSSLSITGASDKTFDNNNLVVNNNASVEITGQRGIQNGTVSNNGNVLINTEGDIVISSDLSGQGFFEYKTADKDSGSLLLSGIDNSGFKGIFNVTNGGVLEFNQTDSNHFFDNSAELNIKASGFEYTSTAKNQIFDADNFVNLNLSDGSTVSVTGSGLGASKFTLSDGWYNSDSVANNLIFNNSDYILNTTFNKTTGAGDNITFNNSNVDLALDDNLTAGSYDMGNANYALNSSTLNVSNKIAGDKYTFNGLTMTDSKIAIDVDLSLDAVGGTLVEGGRTPVADTIDAVNGGGIVEITRLFITGDNGGLMKNEAGEYTKGAIQIFTDAANSLQVAEENNTQILSWATSVYKYGIKSASSDGVRIADSIEIAPLGHSSTDTLRDLNRYELSNGGGNRGFSFIAEKDDSGNTINNSYNIYRDLDTTSEGVFSVLGTVDEQLGKSVLDGTLKELITTAADASNKLEVKEVDSNGNPVLITFEGVEIYADDGTNSGFQYNKDTEEFTISPDSFKLSSNETSGSMFEIVNKTDFYMENVSVQNAKRYESDTIKDGSVIYADNNEANITLSNVDFVNNSTVEGNGGAVANVLSNKLILNTSEISGNTAGADGGAIYNTSAGETTLINITADSNIAEGRGGAIYTAADMQITDADFGKTALNKHKNGSSEYVANDIYVDSATVTFTTSDGKTSSVNSGIAGDGTFIKDGSGTLNLSGVNKDLTGNFEIASGIVNYVQSENGSFIGGSVEVAQDSVLNITNSSQDNINNLSGEGSLNVDGKGTLNLLGDNSGFEGSAAINDGILAYTKTENSSFINGSLAVNKDEQAGTHGVLNYTVNAGDTDALINVSGNGTINKLGDGEAVLTGDNSVFTGDTHVEGTLTYTADNSSDKYFAGTTEIKQSGTLAANISESAKNQTIGNISGEGSFVKEGSGEITLVGNNNFTGTTTVKEGILAYTNSDSDTFVNGGVVINENGSLEYSVVNNDTVDFTNTLSGDGIFNKKENGTLVLNNDNSGFTGTVKVSDGSLNYITSENAKFFSEEAKYVIDSALNLENTKDDTITLNSVTGAGVITKSGTEGLLNLAGDNSGFNGELAIKEGIVSFTKDADISYIAGITNIYGGAALNYTTNVNDTLTNVTGNGIVNKYGDAALTVNEADNNIDTVNLYAGTLNVNGNSVSELGFTTNIKSGIYNYTAVADSNLLIGGDNSKLTFDNASGAQAVFNGGNSSVFNLGLVEGIDGNSITFNDSTVRLAHTVYAAGTYNLNNSVLDLINDSTDNITFGNLNITGNSKLKIDVDLAPITNTPDSDVLNVASGSGALTIALNEINVKNERNNKDDGLHSSYEFNVISENSGVTLDKEASITKWSTNVYEYSVDLKDDNKGIILSAVKASDENSLKAMNQYEGNRGFNFTADDNPYHIGSDLEETKAGSFVVNGLDDGSTIISGEIVDADGNITGQKGSFFDVKNETDLEIKNVTITDANKNGSGSVINVENSDANIALNNVNVQNSTSSGNGGAVSNTDSDSFTLNNGNLSGNTSTGGLGGAIYTAADMIITDTDFGTNGLNNDKNGQNDIYIDGVNTVVTINTDTKDSIIASGIAGNGILDKTGNNILNLSGKNDDFTGVLNIEEGSLFYTQNSADDTYIAGTTVINSSSDAEINNNISDITGGTFEGSGTLTKTGDKDLKISGDNSKFTGNANIEEGSLTFTVNDASDKYFTGTTNINEKGILVVDTNTDTAILKIQGNGTLQKSGSGSIIMMGDNSSFTGNLNVTEGEFAMAAGSSIGNLKEGIFADGTAINLQNTQLISNNDGTFTTSPNPPSFENLSFDTLYLNGLVDMYLDVDLANKIADTIYANNVNGTGNLLIGNGSLNVLSDSLVSNTVVNIASGAVTDRILLGDDAKSVMGPIQRYSVSYGDGNLVFSRDGGSTPVITDVNPSVMAASVATQLGGYLTQLETLQQGFFHMDRYTKYPYTQRLAAEKNNIYASTANPVYNISQLPETSQAMWANPYTSFERVHLKGGIDVSNVTYGTLYGGDTNLTDLGNGFKGVISGFVGYNGSHQSYSGVSMTQNGGTLGATGTIYKDNFFTGVTVSAGAGTGSAYTQYGTDNFSMLTAGIASKTGYNIEFNDGKFILQPTLFLSYSFVNTFDYTNAAGVRIDSDPLNAFTVMPGLKAVANLKNGWQPYAGISMVWNIMDKTKFMANDVRLPQLSVKPYVQYGVGVQKTWGDKFTGFVQSMIRNGGRDGIAFQAGLRWTFGKEPSQYTNSTGEKKYIGNIPKQ